MERRGMERRGLDTLLPGAKVEAKYVVDAERSIDFLGEDLRIYATPKLLRDVEQTCQDFLLEFIAPGQHSIGTRVEIEHLSATRLGQPVHLQAEVTAVDRRRIDFRFELIDAAGQAARGTHQRFVVDIERLRQRIQSQ